MGVLEHGGGGNLCSKRLLCSKDPVYAVVITVVHCHFCVVIVQKPT